MIKSQGSNYKHYFLVIPPVATTVLVPLLSLSLALSFTRLSFIYEDITIASTFSIAPATCLAFF